MRLCVVISSYTILACKISMTIFFVMIRRPPRSTRTDTLFPYTTLFRAVVSGNHRRNRNSRAVLSFPTRRHGAKATPAGAGDGYPEGGITTMIQFTTKRLLSGMLGAALLAALPGNGFAQQKSSEERRVGNECGRRCRTRGSSKP